MIKWIVNLFKRYLDIYRRMDRDRVNSAAVWRVKYLDGEMSDRLTWGEAMYISDCCDGLVIYDPEENDGKEGEK